MTDAADLSSLASSLDDLTRRVTAQAEAAQGGARTEVAAELFEVERALRNALRRLDKLVRAERPPGAP